MNTLRFIVLNGAQARPYLTQIAELRIKVFRDFPYLYDGSLDYEEAYLETYFKSSQSVLILCLRGSRVVGVSTAIALSEESASIQKPFLERGLSLGPYVYFGESVLSQEYRGRGVGKEFFKHRLDFAKRLPAVDWAVFCAVIRSASDPLRPTDYSPLNTFWDKQGFQEWTGMKCSLSWKRMGENTDSSHELQFWRKKI